MIIGSPDKQKKILIALLVVFAVLLGYRIKTSQKQAAAPLKYGRGAVAASSVRRPANSKAANGDPLQAFLKVREAKYPGVSRDIFRMENPAPPKPKPVIKKPETPVVPEFTPPPVPVKTAEELAAEAAHNDLSKFRFLGYAADTDRSLFLSKDGELFIAKSGDVVVKSYKIKEAGKDFVLLHDTATKVEMRIQLTGGK